MGEIRDNEWSGTGRITKGPTTTDDGKTHFKLEASLTQEPFHCVSVGVTAENLTKYVNKGDEITVEGELIYLDFPNEKGKTLVVYARHVSYGRKAKTLSKIPYS